MKARLFLSPSGCMWLELVSEGWAEHQHLMHWAYRCQVHGVHAAGNPVQVDGGLQLVLRDGLLWPAMPPPKPVSGAAPQDLAEDLATLRPGPDGVMPKVEPDVVTAGEPIRPSVVAELPRVPETAIRRLLDLAWDREQFRDADADHMAEVERWLAAVAPKADKAVRS